MIKPLCETIWQLLIKLNTHLPNDPAAPLLGIYASELRTYIQTLYFSVLLFMLFFTLWIILLKITKYWREKNPNVH